MWDQLAGTEDAKHGCDAAYDAAYDAALDHMDKITCRMPQLNLMRRHASKLSTSRGMMKLMKEGELMELV